MRTLTVDLLNWNKRMITRAAYDLALRMAVGVKQKHSFKSWPNWSE